MSFVKHRQPGSFRLDPGLLVRSLALFANFLLIILAYYQVKAASRALLLEYGGSGLFPYAWIISALVLLALIGLYHNLVATHSRVRVVFGSLLLFAALLCIFRLLTPHFTAITALAFYIFVDIFSVVLVEQFWSLTDSVNDSEQGKKSFWFVGTGGLVGGVLGGLLAGALVTHTAIKTPDLLYVCAALLIVTLILNVFMWRAGLYEEVGDTLESMDPSGGWRALAGSRYLMLIAVLLCLSQLAQPIVEYQFLSAVEQSYEGLDKRTAFLGQFFSIMGLASIAINVALTPLIHRKLGIFAGLAVQPLALACSAFGFFLYSHLSMAVIMKIADRGLSYSINRASKELLYIPVDPQRTYQAKAWIDMLGYRLFKVLGSGLILLATKWLPISLTVGELSIITFFVCLLWMLTILAVARQYRIETVSA